MKKGIAIIGAGAISRMHFAAIDRISELVLIAVSDKNPVALHKAKEQYDCDIYENYLDMLADERISIVSIATPSGLHAKMAIDCLNAGKHVIVEKPLAMSLAEISAIANAESTNNRRVGVIYPLRYNGVIEKAKTAIADGKFGQITHASLTIRINRNDDYFAAASWRGSWAMDGGCLMNQAIHGIDLLIDLIGEPVSVFGVTRNNLRSIEAEDVGVAIVNFASGAVATIEAATTIYDKTFEEKLAIFGESGTLIIGGKNFGQVEFSRFSDLVTEAELSEKCSFQFGNGHYLTIKNFTDALIAGDKNYLGVIDGRRAVELILAIYHSSKNDELIKLPLEEKFTIGLGV